MRINGKITEIITSRALVSFGGFVELEGKALKHIWRTNSCVKAGVQHFL